MKSKFILLLYLSLKGLSLSFGEALPNFEFNERAYWDCVYTDVKFTPVHNQLVIGTQSGVDFYDANTRQFLQHIDTPKVLMMKWSDDGTLLFIIALNEMGTDDHTCYIYNYQQKQVVIRFDLSIRWVIETWSDVPAWRPHNNFIDISPDNQYFAYVSDWNQLIVLNIYNCQVLIQKKMKDKYINMIKFSDKESLYIGGMDCIQLRYDLDTYHSNILELGLLNNEILSNHEFYNYEYYKKNIHINI